MSDGKGQKQLENNFIFQTSKKIYKQWWCKKKRHPIKKVDIISQTRASNEVTEQQAYNEILFVELVLAK